MKEFRDSSMSLDGVELLPKASVKYHGVELDSNLEWNELKGKVFTGSEKTE